MSSILTNASAMTALQTLRSIDDNLSVTQSRISNGLKVATAKDNAAYWSIATTMRSDVSSLGAVYEGLGIGASQVDTASTAVASLIDVVKSIRDRIASAGQDGVDRGKIRTELSQLNAQLQGIVDSASTNGKNWLSPGTETSANVVSGINRQLAGTTLQTINIGLTATSGKNVQNVVTDIAAINVTDADDIATMGVHLTTIDTALGELTEIGSVFGAGSYRIDLQTNFVKDLTHALDRGIGALVDADMNEESTRLKALQTQQQLAVQGLSIANSKSESLLQLFR